MTTQYERVFGVRTLNGQVLESFQEADFLGFGTSLFELGRDLAPDGNVLEWDEVQMPVSAAPFTTRSSPASVVSGTTVLNRTSGMATIKLRKHLTASQLFGSRAPGNLRDDVEAVVGQEMRALAKRINLAREYLAIRALNGSVVVSPATVPGTNISFTLTFPVSTYTPAATWSNSGTLLSSVEIPGMIDRYYELARLQAARALIGRNVKRYIRQNTEITSVITNDPNPENRLIMANQVLGPAFNTFRFHDLDWVSVNHGYNAGAVFTLFHPEDNLVLLPRDQDLSDVLAFGEGYGDIPSSAIGQGAGVIGQASQRGMFSYAVASEDPVGIDLFMGWTGLYVLAFPAGVLTVDTTL